MGTRAQIEIVGTGLKAYQHFDGYPEGVLPTIVPFLCEFRRVRGWDDEYLAARLTHRMVAAALEESAEHGLTDRMTGYGIGTAWHCDLDYVYRITQQWHVEVWEVVRDTFGVRAHQEFGGQMFRLLYTIDVASVEAKNLPLAHAPQMALN